MAESILGLSAYYHDSAAALITDGVIVAAAHEDRFTRQKHDKRFPAHAVEYVLGEGGLSLDDVDAAAFYDKPYVKFERLLETYHSFAPVGLRSFHSAIPVWIKEKLFTRKLLRDELAAFGAKPPRLVFPEHHLSHAASAFFPSPFAEAAILTNDGVGEWATTTVGHGVGNRITILKEQRFPHSLGLLYSAFTYYCGFRVNSGEYKLMGLAPYGNPESSRTRAFLRTIREELVDIREDGSLLLNMANFSYATGLKMCPEDKWRRLFGIPRRTPESELSQEYMDLAFAIQQVTEDVVLRLAKTAKTLTGAAKLVLAGGVALNCVANGRLLRSGLFDDLWVQPAAGDAGGALGAAYAAWHIWKDRPRKAPPQGDAMFGAFLGPEFSELDIRRTARAFQAPYRKLVSRSDEVFNETARLLAQGKVVGWFQGRMEYGPRALGARSILGDPRCPEMQKRLNVKIKHRESFRPFAPSILEEDTRDYFDLTLPSPYMTLVAPVVEQRRLPVPEDYHSHELYRRLYWQRSDIPAVTHVDFSARIQTVGRDTNERFWKLINAFKQITGCAVIVNTSFNVRGEPIVCTPEDAYRCFMRTDMDYLVLGDHLFAKSEQPPWDEDADTRSAFELD